MKLGFHIPFSHTPELIGVLGSELLAPGHFDWIEVKYPYDMLGFDPRPYEDAIRSLIERHDPQRSLHIPTHYDIGMWSASVRETILTQIERTIDFAASLGCTVLPIHPGTILHMDIPQGASAPNAERVREAALAKKRRAFDHTVSALKQLSDRAARHDMTLALENVLLPQEIAYSAADLIELIDAVDRENVRALFDCGHAHRAGYESSAFVFEIAPYLCHVHVNDNDGSCDLHQQLGTGTIDFASMFDALEASNYTGAVVVETAYRSAAELKESARLIGEYREAAGVRH
jgi:sugar phosphate isomerase/epimerase